MAKKIVEKVLSYKAIFEPAEECGFSVTVPKLPGLVTEGDTFEEALERAEDAINGYLLVLQEAGESIPEPDTRSFTTTIEIKFPNPKFAQL